MDMKKILQAIDGSSNKPQVETSDMKRFVSIIAEGTGKLNRLTTAESIAVQHYTSPTKNITSPVLNVAKDATPSMVGKYFKQVEEEFAESQDRYKDRARQLAERVIEAGGNYGHHSNFNRHVSQSKSPPEHIMNMAKKGAKVSSKRRYQSEEKESVDSVTMDIPLLVRLMEFAREDANSNTILHKMVERLIEMSEEGQSLSMSDYEDIVGSVDESLRTDNPCWKNYKPVGTKKKNGKTVPNCVPKK